MASSLFEELNLAIDSDAIESLIAFLDSRLNDERATSSKYDEVEKPAESQNGFSFDSQENDERATSSKDDEVEKPTESQNGFNFDAILKHILNCAKHHKRTEAELKRDIRQMVLVGLCRGNIRRDQLARTARAGALIIKELAYRYQIPMRSSARERIRMQSDTLTFVRAISCFPHLASIILYKKAGLAKNGERTVLASEQLPDAMKHSGFSGLIPKDCNPYLRKAYVFAHAAYMVDFGKLINPGDRESWYLEGLMFETSDGLKVMASKQLNICKAVVDKSRYPDGIRVGVLRAVGLTDPDVFKKIVDVCNNLCKVVGEPELSFETAEEYHIKNGKICFLEDDTKDVATGEQTMNLADKLKESSIHESSTSKN